MIKPIAPRKVPGGVLSRLKLTWPKGWLKAAILETSGGVKDPLRPQARATSGGVMKPRQSWLKPVRRPKDPKKLTGAHPKKLTGDLRTHPVAGPQNLEKLT